MPRNRRLELDVRKLLTSEFDASLVEDDLRHLQVQFPGPKNTPYEGGLWLVNVELPSDYPYQSPSVGFATPIFHPNIERERGSVCLDVLNRTWTPIFGLVNIFQVFLPQLLAYPNAGDPLNHEAGRAWENAHKANDGSYDRLVKRWIRRYARPGGMQVDDEDDDKVLSDVSLSSLDSDED